MTYYLALLTRLLRSFEGTKRSSSLDQPRYEVFSTVYVAPAQMFFACSVGDIIRQSNFHVAS